MKSKLLLACALTLLLATTRTARAGGTLVVCDDIKEPETLDPQHEFTEKNHVIVQQIYDGLVRFGPNGKIEPALAVSYDPPTLDAPVGPNPPAMRMRFHLRQGVAFHNGEAFDAESVRFSIHRYLNPSFPAFGFISSINHVDVIDPYTVEIVTNYPDGLLLQRLAGFVVMVPPKYVKEKGEKALDREPVGTGAFRLEKWDTAGSRIELSANKSYWLKDCPKLDKLVFRFVPADQQAQLLLKGEVDLVTELPGTYATEVQQKSGTYVKKLPTFWTVGADMNVTTGPLADVRVRRALNLAINRDDLVRYDGGGNGQVPASLTMAGEEGHNPDLKPYAYDPGQAKQLLAEAGVKTPLVLRTHIRAQGQRTAAILAAQFRKIGVQLEIKTFSDADVIASLHDPNQHWDIGIAGLPDPMCNSFFIECLLLSSKSPFSLTKDDKFDQMLGAFMTTMDEPKRDAVGRELDKYVYDQALSLFTYQKIKTYGLSQRVTFVPYVSGMPYFFSTSVTDRSIAGAPDSTRTDAETKNLR